MLNIGEDALKCDMAETYHIHIVDWENPPYPISYLADLANGLGNNSRIRRKMSNTTLTLEESFQAIIIDKLSILVWQNTKDGLKGRNMPESVYRKLEGLDDKVKDEVELFESEEAFLEWYSSKTR